MSCILKAVVPKAVAHKKRRAVGRAMNWAHTALNLGWTWFLSAAARCGLRGSCFHSAMALSTRTTKALPCTTCTKCSGVNCANSTLKIKLPLTAPTNSMV